MSSRCRSAKIRSRFEIAPTQACLRLASVSPGCMQLAVCLQHVCKALFTDYRGQSNVKDMLISYLWQHTTKTAGLNLVQICFSQYVPLFA